MFSMLVRTGVSPCLTLGSGQGGFCITVNLHWGLASSNARTTTVRIFRMTIVIVPVQVYKEIWPVLIPQSEQQYHERRILHSKTQHWAFIVCQVRIKTGRIPHIILYSELTFYPVQRQDKEMEVAHTCTQNWGSTLSNVRITTGRILLICTQNWGSTLSNVKITKWRLRTLVHGTEVPPCPTSGYLHGGYAHLYTELRFHSVQHQDIYMEVAHTCTQKWGPTSG